MIQRYEHGLMYMVMSNIGPYILYADHEAAMQEKDREIAIRDRAVERRNQAIDRLIGQRKQIEADNADLLTKLEEAKGEIERLDASETKLIKERDFREEQINKIADALGDESEWSNCSDRGQNALELAEQITAELADLRAKLAEAEKALNPHKEFFDDQTTE